MKKINILLIALAIGIPAFAIGEGGFNFNPMMNMNMYNPAGMSSLHDMQSIQDQQRRLQEQADWQERQRRLQEADRHKEVQPDGTTLQKIINKKHPPKSRFVEQDGELKIEHE